MSNTQQQVQQIEINIDMAKKQIAVRKAILELESNTNFKKVILEGYFETEASRLVLLKSDIEMQKPEDQEHIIRQIDAIGTFRQYLGTCIALGSMSEKALADDLETHDELLSEDLEEEAA